MMLQRLTITVLTSFFLKLHQVRPVAEGLPKRTFVTVPVAEFYRPRRQPAHSVTPLRN